MLKLESIIRMKGWLQEDEFPSRYIYERLLLNIVEKHSDIQLSSQFSLQAGRDGLPWIRHSVTFTSVSAKKSYRSACSKF